MSRAERLPVKSVQNNTEVCVCIMNVRIMARKTEKYYYQNGQNGQNGQICVPCARGQAGLVINKLSQVEVSAYDGRSKNPQDLTNSPTRRTA